MSDDATHPDPSSPPPFLPPPPGATPPSPGAWAPPGTGAPASGAPGASGAEQPEISVGGEPQRTRRSPAKLVAATVGVAALIGAGVFAVVRLRDDAEAKGGAASPVEAGQAFVDALDQEDVLGLVDVLLPGERETFHDPIVRFVDHLRRLDVLDDSATAERVGGLDIRITDSDVTAEPTNVDDITDIVIEAEATVSVDGDEVPLGSLLLDEAFGGERPDMDVPADDPAPASFRFAAVQQDGRWYLSLFHTAAETLRLRSDRPVPEVGLEPDGADTPEGAVTEMIERAAELDLRGVLQILDPDEFGALQRYAPMFLDDAEADLADPPFSIGLSDVEATADGSGDRRSVSLQSLSARVTDERSGETHEITFADGCVSGDLIGEEPVCQGDQEGSGGAIDDLIDQLDQLQADDAPEAFDPQQLEQLLRTVQDAMSDYDSSGVEVHQVDGEWYVSPMRTVYEQFDNVLSALDAGELRDIVEQAKAFAHRLDVGELDLPDAVQDQLGG